MTATADLLARCSFPPPGSAATCAVSGGADSLALLVLAVEGGCEVTAVHVDHGLRPGSGREADLVADVAERWGAAFRSVAVEVPAGPDLEARARRARYDAPPGRRAHRPHGRRPGRDRAPQPAARRRPRRPHGLRSRPASAASACGAARPTSSAPTSGSSRSTTRPTTTRASVATACATSCSRSSTPSPSATSPRCWRARPTTCGPTPTSSTSCRARSTPPTPGRWPPHRRRWPREPCAGGCATGPEQHPPDAATVARVLAVARGEATACEVGGGLVVRRHAQRLYVADRAG